MRSTAGNAGSSVNFQTSIPTHAWAESATRARGAACRISETVTASPTMAVKQSYSLTVAIVVNAGTCACFPMPNPANV